MSGHNYRTKSGQCIKNLGVAFCFAFMLPKYNLYNISGNCVSITLSWENSEKMLSVNISYELMEVYFHVYFLYVFLTKFFRAQATSLDHFLLLLLLLDWCIKGHWNWSKFVYSISLSSAPSFPVLRFKIQQTRSSKVGWKFDI